VKKHAATVVREIAKHTPELAQLVVGNGGVAALVDYVSESSGNNRLPGIMALGYIAAFRCATGEMHCSCTAIQRRKVCTVSI
jgi:DNA-binding IclR family transcriptional regulator